MSVPLVLFLFGRAEYYLLMKNIYHFTLCILEALAINTISIKAKNNILREKIEIMQEMKQTLFRISCKLNFTYIIQNTHSKTNLEMSFKVKLETLINSKSQSIKVFLYLHF